MKQIIFMASVLLFFTSFVSCKKKIDDTLASTSRAIRYKVIGNFTGTMFASYTNAGGSTANEPVSSLPWNKEITYNKTVTAAIVAFSGNGGVAGQQITIVVEKGDRQVSSTTAIAGGSGSFTQSSPVITF